MSNLILWGLVILVLASVVTSSVLMVMMGSLRKSLRQLTEDKARLAGRLTALESELGVMMDGTFGMGEKLETLRYELKEIVTSQQRIEQRDLGQQPYEQAARMAEQGETEDQMMKRCGLSRAEIELVRLLHPEEKAVY